jgi:aspartate/methionine/tyrosine aminotransferase
VLDQIADTFLSVNAPVALALPALLELAPRVLTNALTRLRGNYLVAQHKFTEAGFRARRAEGGWMLLVDAPPDAAVTGDDLALWLLRQAHISVHPGWFYDLDSYRTLALSLLNEPDQFSANCDMLIDSLHRFDPV